jgi:hypothetical protein
MNAIFICRGVHGIGNICVIEFLQHVFGTCQPAIGLNNDVRGGLINRLDNIVGADIGSQFLDNNLRVLTARLKETKSISNLFRASLQ